MDGEATVGGREWERMTRQGLWNLRKLLVNVVDSVTVCHRSLNDAGCFSVVQRRWDAGEKSETGQGRCGDRG